MKPLEKKFSENNNIPLKKILPRPQNVKRVIWLQPNATNFVTNMFAEYNAVTCLICGVL